MEKLKGNLVNQSYRNLKSLFVKRSEASNKPEIQWSTVKIVSISSVVVFIAVVLLLPTEPDTQFSGKLEDESQTSINKGESTNTGPSRQVREDIWASPEPRAVGSSGGSVDVNYNTSMILGPKGQNSKTQVRAGQRMPLRILDKFIVSDSSVPVIADLLMRTETESGLTLPAGTRFYGEASYQKGQNRAQIRFTQISIPSGRIRQISGMALGKDGQPGIPGRVSSDGAKNTAGQILTTFVAGLAGGSVETDMFGRSRGGIENGLLSAVSSTAKDRAQNYGEKLKAEREWIEVPQGAECDATFDQSLELQMDGEN